MNKAIFSFKDNSKVKVTYSHSSRINRYCFVFNDRLFYLGCSPNLECSLSDGSRRWVLNNFPSHIFVDRFNITKDNWLSYLNLINKRKKFNIYTEDDYLLDSYLHYYHDNNLCLIKNVYDVKINDLLYEKNNIYKVIDITYDSITLKSTFDEWSTEINKKKFMTLKLKKKINEYC